MEKDGEPLEKGVGVMEEKGICVGLRCSVAYYPHKCYSIEYTIDMCNLHTCERVEIDVTYCNIRLE